MFFPHLNYELFVKILHTMLISASKWLVQYLNYKEIIFEWTIYFLLSLWHHKHQKIKKKKTLKYLRGSFPLKCSWIWVQKAAYFKSTPCFLRILVLFILSSFQWTSISWLDVIQKLIIQEPKHYSLGHIFKCLNLIITDSIHLVNFMEAKKGSLSLRLSLW